MLKAVHIVSNHDGYIVLYCNMFQLTLHQMSSYGGHCESNMPFLSILSVSL